MSFVTTLFRAIDSADKVIVGGVEVLRHSDSSDGARVLHLANKTEVLVSDSKIKIDGGGNCTSPGYYEDNPTEAFSVRFIVEKPLSRKDLK